MQAWDRYAYVNNSPVNYTDPTGHMLTDGCSYEGCTGDQFATVHTILINQYLATRMKPQKDELPDKNPEPIRNVIEQLLNAIGLVGEGLEAMSQNDKNIATFLTYSEVEGAVSNITYTVWNKSDTIVLVRSAAIHAVDWRNSVPFNRFVFSKGTVNVSSQDGWVLSSIYPGGKESISLTNPNNWLEEDIQPFRPELSVNVSIAVRIHVWFGYMQYQDKVRIGAPRIGW